MKTRAGVFLSAVIVLSCIGCGTLITRYVSPNWTPPAPALPRIYSGTLFDLRCFFRPAMHETQGIGGFCLVDLPFSIVADTVILPLTIYEQVKYGSYAAARQHEGAQPATTTSQEKQ